MRVRMPLSWPEFLLRLFGALIVVLLYAYWRWRKDTKDRRKGRWTVKEYSRKGVFPMRKLYAVLAVVFLVIGLIQAGAARKHPQQRITQTLACCGIPMCPGPPTCPPK